MSGTECTPQPFHLVSHDAKLLWVTNDAYQTNGIRRCNRNYWRDYSYLPIYNFAFYGNVDATSNVTVHDTASIFGAIQTVGKMGKSRDLVGMNYPTSNTHNVSQLLQPRALVRVTCPQDTIFTMPLTKFRAISRTRPRLLPVTLISLNRPVVFHWELRKRWNAPERGPGQNLLCLRRYLDSQQEHLRLHPRW